MHSSALFRTFTRTCVCVLAVATSLSTEAASQLVDSLPALKTALEQAAPGDVITVKNGLYSAADALTIRCTGTADQPITIAAETVGGVEISGPQGIKVSEPAAHVIITGFIFSHAAGKTQIADGASHVRFSRNTFACAGEGAYLNIIGDDAQIDYNEFATKKASGPMIAVSGTGSQVARRLWIHHNYFHDFDNDGATGAEMLRYGLLSSHRASQGAGLVEHNLFARCRGVNDMVSNRSSGNTYRYNTFIDSPTSHLTIRQGNDCVIAANHFINTEGVRIYGDRHLIFSNYFEKNYIAINLGNGDIEFTDAPDASTNLHDRPDDCVIVFNTFLNNATHFQMSKRSGNALGAIKTVFANNLIAGGNVAAKIDGPFPGTTWSGNLLWETVKPDDLPADSFTRADPLLVVGADSISRPQTGSPALEAAKGDFPRVAFDLDGQPRPEKKSIGADEPGTAPALARLLTPTDVGPHAQLPARPAAVEPPLTPAAVSAPVPTASAPPVP